MPGGIAKGTEGVGGHLSPKQDSSVPSRTPQSLTSRRNTEACLYMVETKGQATVKAN